MSKTTVVIPNYNGIKYIEACLESLRTSTVPTDIIVVDNGSEDGSRELVLEKFKEVKVIALQENTGFCHAVNVGIEAASTPYIFLLNNDTTIKEDAIEVLEKDMEKFEKAFSVQSKMVKMQNPDEIDSAGDLYCALGWAFAIGKDKKASKYQGLHRVFSSCGGASIYRKPVLDEIGLFDENHFAYLEDVDLGYRANIFGYENYADMNSLIYHAGSGFSGSRYNEFKVIHSARNSIYLIYKNMPLLQKIVNLPFLLLGYFVKWMFFVRKGLGKTYFRGIKDGFSMCHKEECKAHKIKFRFKRLGRYIIIEFKLIGNMIRRFV